MRSMGVMHLPLNTKTWDSSRAGTVPNKKNGQPHNAAKTASAPKTISPCNPHNVPPKKSTTLKSATPSISTHKKRQKRVCLIEYN
jgi:hypothetical protein